MLANQAQPIIEQFLLREINDYRQGKPGKQYFLLGWKSYSPMNLVSIDSDSPSSVKLELATVNSMFAELGLCFTFPYEICENLEEMGMPMIHSNHRRMIASTMDTQDQPMKPFNRSVRLDLTISRLATFLANWLSKKHPKIQLITPLVS